MIITSLDNKKIKKYLKLKQKKYRDLDKLFLIEGQHLAIEAIKNNYFNYLMSGLDKNKAELEKEKLEAMTTTTTVITTITTN